MVWFVANIGPLPILDLPPDEGLLDLAIDRLFAAYDRFIAHGNEYPPSTFVNLSPLRDLPFTSLLYGTREYIVVDDV